MKMKQALLGLSLFSMSVSAEKEGNRFHPAISWTAPLDYESDFKNWDFRASTIALEKKIVLAPNGH